MYVQFINFVSIMKIETLQDLREEFLNGQENIWQIETQKIKMDNSQKSMKIRKNIRKHILNYPEFIKFHLKLISHIESDKHLLSIHIFDRNVERICDIRETYRKKITPLYKRTYSNKISETEVKKIIRTKTESFINHEILILQATNSLISKFILNL